MMGTTTLQLPARGAKVRYHPRLLEYDNVSTAEQG